MAAKYKGRAKFEVNRVLAGNKVVVQTYCSQPFDVPLLKALRHRKCE